MLNLVKLCKGIFFWWDANLVYYKLFKSMWERVATIYIRILSGGVQIFLLIVIFRETALGNAIV